MTTAIVIDMAVLMTVSMVMAMRISLAMAVSMVMTVAIAKGPRPKQSPWPWTCLAGTREACESLSFEGQLWKPCSVNYGVFEDLGCPSTRQELQNYSNITHACN